MSLSTTSLHQNSKDSQIYPETIYYSERISGPGHQPVLKKLLPDGEPTELLPKPSQKLWNHSPTGFSWGYGGSGPAQLALALLLDATGDTQLAIAFHQPFKWAKVAKFGDSWHINTGEIMVWLENQKKDLLRDRVGKN